MGWVGIIQGWCIQNLKHFASLFNFVWQTSSECTTMSLQWCIKFSYIEMQLWNCFSNSVSFCWWTVLSLGAKPWPERMEWKFAIARFHFFYLYFKVECQQERNRCDMLLIITTDSHMHVMNFSLCEKPHCTHKDTLASCKIKMFIHIAFIISILY